MFLPLFLKKRMWYFGGIWGGIIACLLFIIFLAWTAPPLAPPPGSPLLPPLPTAAPISPLRSLEEGASSRGRLSNRGWACRKKRCSPAKKDGKWNFAKSYSKIMISDFFKNPAIGKKAMLASYLTLPNNHQKKQKNVKKCKNKHFLVNPL